MRSWEELKSALLRTTHRWFQPSRCIQTYKRAGKVKLNVFIEFPADWKPEDQRPAIVLFFGGSWKKGSPGQLKNQCRYLASRGMVAMAADYRVASRHQVKVVSCVADAKSAIRWVRANAGALGIDFQRIAAGGISTGGHIACATAMAPPDHDDPTDDQRISCTPNAMVLFNPALLLAPMDGVPLQGFMERVPPENFGCPPAELSPMHHIKAGLPPTLIIHGKTDTTVPYSSAELFRDRMVAAGNRCELIGWDNQSHGFFNFGRNSNRFAFSTLQTVDQFLASLGWLRGEPNVEEYFAANPPTK